MNSTEAAALERMKADADGLRARLAGYHAVIEQMYAAIKPAHEELTDLLLKIRSLEHVATLREQAEAMKAS